MDFQYHRTDRSNLFPTLPYAVRDPRYRAAIIRVLGSSTVVPLRDDLIRVPSHQSREWTISAHSEGKCYAHTKAQVGIRVVTEAHVAEPRVSDQLNAWLHIICGMITEKQALIPESLDLFLEIHQDPSTCNYYFADHTRRTVFWLHTLDTIGVGRLHAISSSHQFALQENYWIHVEQFPETASQYSAVALNELQALLLDDHAGSETLTFPYTATQREELVDLLERSKDHASSPHITTYVARLWATIDHCRLSSDQSILKVPDGKRNLVLTIVSRTLLFGLPDVYRARFKGLWLDQLVNTSRWRKHVSGTVQNLKQTMSWIVALLILNIAMIPITTFTVFIKSSSLLCILGLAMGSVLLREQQSLVGVNATTAAEHLDDRDINYSFQWTAMARSLPHALFAWALLLLGMQGFWMTFADPSLPINFNIFFYVATGLVVVCVGIWKAVYPRQKVIKHPVLPEPIPLISAVPQK